MDDDVRNTPLATTSSSTTKAIEEEFEEEFEFEEEYPDLDCLDEKLLLADVDCERLIYLAKTVLEDIYGPEPKYRVSKHLAPDFEFLGPMVSLGKTQFLKFLDRTQMHLAFPDRRMNCYNFRVDPIDKNRVWLINRIVGTHTQTLMGKIKPTYRKVELPPTAVSLTFNEKDVVTKYTAFVMDRSVGNSQGYSGPMGIFSAVGEKVPMPEIMDEHATGKMSTEKTNNMSLRFKLRAWLWARNVAKETNKRTKLENQNRGG